MNQTQLKYATERAKAIYSARLGSLTFKHTVPRVKFSTKERLDAIAKGEFTLRPYDLDHYHRGIDAYFVFDGERDELVDRAGLDDALSSLKADFDRLMDELVLGDNHTALALLEAFEASATNS